MATISEPVPSVGSPPLYSDASPVSLTWGAIIAGAVAAIISAIVLSVLGSGVGLSMISPWPGAGASATTVGVSAAVAVVVVQWVSSAFGGFMAGRLRSKWDRVHADETFFRDTAHGFLAWAVASLVGVLLFASLTASAVGGIARGVADVASAASSNVDQADMVQPDAAGLAGWEYFVGTLFRSPNGARGDRADSRTEAAGILARSIDNGHVALSPEDRTYLVQLVSEQANLDAPAAASRVDAVIDQINVASDRARQAADAARKRTAQISILTALSMMIGAFIASAAGALGGTFRDEY